MDRKCLHTPVTRILGNLVTSTDEITDMVLEAEGLKYICNLLNHTNPVIRKESAWTISNIAAGTTTQVQMLYDLGVYNKVISLIHEDLIEVRNECGYIISNSFSKKNEQMSRKLISTGCLDILI